MVVLILTSLQEILEDLDTFWVWSVHAELSDDCGAMQSHHRAFLALNKCFVELADSAQVFEIQVKWMGVPGVANIHHKVVGQFIG